MPFTADLNGVALRVATMADCSPLGAVMMGTLGLSVYGSLDELAALPRDEIVYLPTISNQSAEVLYAGWQRAVRQTLTK
jgi:glycerol kinase